MARVSQAVVGGKILNISDYDLLRHSYYGTGGFATGEYLARHKRELLDNYQMRQAIAYFLNYVAPVVNSHINPVFRAEAQRNWTGSVEQWERFMEDADRRGYSLPRCMKNAGLEAKLFGVTYLVLDNVAEPPPTVADALASRSLPYLYTITPDRVPDDGIKTDQYGRLIEITWMEIRTNEKGEQITEYKTWTTTGWTLKSEKGEVLKSGSHLLGRVPVVPLLSRMVGTNLKPSSEFLSIAKTNLHIYQLCSWLSEMLQNQAFAILTLPTKEGAAPTKVNVGTNNALAYDQEAKSPPAFIAPPADPATMLQSQIDRLIQEIYRMAALSLATGTKEAASGIAKAFDFEATNTVLADFAQQCEHAEKQIAELFALWTKQPFEYECGYPADFGLTDIEQELKNAGLVLDLGIESELLLVAIVEKLLTVYLPDLSAEDFDAIIAEVKAKGADALASVKKYVPGGQQQANNQEPKQDPNQDPDVNE